MGAKIAKGIFIIAIFNYVYTPSYSQLFDDFSDNEFSSNPKWSGNENDFIVEGEILRLNADAVTSSSYLATESVISLEAEWNFTIKLDFNPSSSNYAKVYIMADSENLDQDQNGYFVKIGGTPDEISLYKVVDGTETILIDGLDGRVDISSFEVSIQVTRSESNVWNLKSRLFGEPDFSSEGTIIDAEIQSSSFFGFYCKYTSTRSTKFYFDNISVNGSPYVDPDPAILISTFTPTRHKILLGFNEALDMLEAKQFSHYLLNGSETPVNVEAVSVDTLLLEFTDEHKLINTLELIAIPDLVGNTLDTLFEVVFVDTSPYTYRDLVINEIFADPNPQEDLPAFEFIELFNNSQRNIDLDDWQFTDGSKTVTFSSQIIYPDSFLIICNNEAKAAYENFGTTVGVANLPTLNNGGDALQLFDKDSMIIDSLTYSLAWYKDSSKDNGGWSLEQVNPNSTCLGACNWEASKQVGGGTPGKINSVFDLGLDEDPPVLLSVSTPSKHQIRLIFNEELDSLESLNKIYYTLNGLHQPVSVFLLELNTMIIDFEAEIDLSNTLSLHSLSDTSGNKLDTLVQVYFIDPAPSIFRDVVINEVFADPNPQEDLPLFEFVELLNISDKIIDIGDWKFSDGSKKAIFPNHLLFPDSILIICSVEAQSEYQQYGKTLGLAEWPALNNGSDKLGLITSQMVVADSFTYNQDWYKNSSKADGGWSLEQINPLSKCLGLYNWSASISLAGGTPGKPNSVYSINTDFEPPEITRALATDSLVEVWFSESIVPGSVITSISPGNITSTSNLSTATNYLSFQLDKSLSVDNNYYIDIPLEDCNGNLQSSSSNLIPIATPNKNSIVVNEILFNPYTNGSDFVELFNTTNYFFNLKNYSIANEENSQIISDSTLLLAPNSILALSKNIVFLKNEYLAPDSSLVEAGLPSMPNDEGVVILSSNSGRVIDSAFYSDDYHFSLIANTEGVSLERISPFENSNNKDNWKSAAETTRFATPGYENSQSRMASSVTNITVIPEVLTPNNDGQADYCQIAFSLTEKSRTISIQVFSINGQLVKTIVRNDIISPAGFFTWDGTNEQGGALPTAHYIIVSEVITTDGQTLIFRNKVVVANGF